MLMLVRHLMAITALPLTVTLLVPLWIGQRYHTTFRIGASAPAIGGQFIGLILMVIGLVLFGASLWYFAVRGRGTLAPWDPPKALVVEGPYRYVRNPMISGVIFILFGEGLLLLSWPHARWALFFLSVNVLSVPVLEKPALVQRFGNAYHLYQQHVRRFLPRIKPRIQPSSI